LGTKSAGEASRVHGTYTFSDLQEMATDLATVMDLIKNPPMLEGDPEDMEDPTVTYTNHAFHWQNRSYNDLLLKKWVPAVVAGLTGLDVGFRTYEPANVALEVEIEVVDKNGKRVRKEGEEDKEKSYLIPIEEDAFDDLHEWLVLYHGVKPKKVYKKDKANDEKNYFLKLSLSQLQNFYYQKYRLSLIGLLFKNNLFVTEVKYKVYHPFKYSIEIVTHKANTKFDELDKAIRNISKIKYLGLKLVLLHLNLPNKLKLNYH
jgi:hypothetical protein